MITYNNIFKLKRYKDYYRVINLYNNIINYELYKIDCYNNNILLEENTILENDFKTLPIISDGNYKIIINNIEVYFNSWINLRTELISKIGKVLCCNCNNSIEETDNNCISKEGNNCIRNQSIYNLIQSYSSFIKNENLNEPLIYNTFIYNFIQRTIIDNHCLIEKELHSQLQQTCIKGTTVNNSKLFKIYIAITYLACYLYELSNIDITDSTEEITIQRDYIKAAYNYNIISSCITKLGLNTATIINNNINNNKIYYYQLNNPSLSFEDELGNITSSYISSKNYKEFSIFKQGTIINYSTIGRLVFVFDNVDNNNFLVNDSLGNDITDEFDITYLANNRYAVYISKISYSIGNLYFKFKEI